jgi:hypothetical protein
MHHESIKYIIFLPIILIKLSFEPPIKLSIHQIISVQDHFFYLEIIEHDNNDKKSFVYWDKLSRN